MHSIPPRFLYPAEKIKQPLHAIRLPSVLETIVTDYVVEKDTLYYSRQPFMLNERGEVDESVEENRLIKASIQTILTSREGYDSEARRAIFETMQDKDKNYRRCFAQLLFRIGFVAPICLSKTDMRELNLSGLNLNQLIADSADFSDSDLSDSSMIWANLSGANLTRTNFKNANLQSSDLRDAILNGTIFIQTNLRGVNTSRAAFTQVRFVDTTVRTMTAPAKLAKLAIKTLDGDVCCGVIGKDEIYVCCNFTQNSTTENVKIDDDYIDMRRKKG